jgi:hypothetical protein
LIIGGAGIVGVVEMEDGGTLSAICDGDELAAVVDEETGAVSWCDAGDFTTAGVCCKVGRGGAEAEVGGAETGA